MITAVAAMAAPEALPILNGDRIYNFCNFKQLFNF